jgi:ABC-2 type transport system ATP-binding protein
MLQASGLVKSFNGLLAVDGVSFSLEPGRILGLLGPNGAGKTTTVSMICGLLRPDGGSVTVCGRPIAGDADPVKRHIGLVPQDLALHRELSAHDNLAFFGALYGMGGKMLDRAVDGQLAFVGLADRARSKVSQFSGGMQRRLNLAAGLLHDPDVLLLDEPTVGVDPQSRNAIFENLEALKRRGKALLYTTHYMEEAERLCDRIVILDRGKVIADDTVQGLARRIPPGNRLRVELESAAEGEGWVEGLSTLPGVDSLVREGQVLSLRLRNLSASAPAVLSYLAANRVTYTSVQSERTGLEDVFLALTGRELRDA